MEYEYEYGESQCTPPYTRVRANRRHGGPGATLTLTRMYHRTVLAYRRHAYPHFRITFCTLVVAFTAGNQLLSTRVFWRPIAEYEYEYNMWIPCAYGKGLFEPDCPCKPGTPGCEIPDVPCEEHYVRDCNDKCSPAFWIGNGQCDNVAEKKAKKTIKKG